MADKELFGNSEQLNDLISRQAAIDALEKVAELFPWKVPGNRDSYDRYNEAWNDAIGRAEIEIEKLPSAQQWIPISEGLPEMTDTYLVQVGVNENGEGMHTEARTADWNAVWQTWYVHTTRCLVGDIIKWMPIPWEGSDRHEG